MGNEQHLGDKRKSSAAKIADHLGFDGAEMSNYRYQSTRYNVAVYAIGDFYYSAGEKAPKRIREDVDTLVWRKVVSWRGDTIWVARVEELKRENAPQ